ncbi:hypothetical protein F511_42289 [Dorcoceras hygrometricum]|uniref:Uncharacterized protein n=1 Tax=Dorcoceras hygrometricum TaxID=472368 RepID=A0A2Z7CPG6_9LAMI|nr:hypothetical protein F511_42289 [Dorcoceras hygrometricum]
MRFCSQPRIELPVELWYRMIVVSRGNRHFTVDCGRLRQSGPRPEMGFLHQPALEGLTRSARTDSPRQDWPEQIPAARGGAQGRRRRLLEEGRGGGDKSLGLGLKSHSPKSSYHAQHIELSIRAGISNPVLVTLNGSGIQLAVGPQPLRLRNHNSGLAQRIMVRASSNIAP